MAQMNEFVSVLFQSRTQAHVFHLQTTSHAEHKALGAYYEEIIELTDSLVESYQGCYGRVLNWESKPIANWAEGKSAAYFKSLYDYVQSARKTLEQESWVQNQIDSIAQLIAETMFLLTLK